jgi:hypothetical protein
MDATNKPNQAAGSPLPDLSIGESVETLVQGLPQPVRDFLDSPARDELMRGMTAAYQLHFDQAAVLERETLLMLLGAETPEEFSKALDQDADLSPEVISGIMNDLNRKVFLPIQEKMRTAPAPTLATAPLPPRPAPTPRPAPPPPPSISFGAPAAPAVPIPATPPPPRPMPPAPSNLPGADLAPEPPKLAARTMQTDFPGGQPAPTPASQPRPAPPMPVRFNEPSVAPRPVAAVPATTSRQAAPAPRPVTPPPKAPAPAPVQPASPPNAPRAVPLKQYGVDPYREPLE